MINEHKKNRRAVKYNIKPRNFVAKNATTSGAGEHKDKSKELPRKAKHKNKEMDMAEGFPQPGESSGKAKQFNPNAKVQTREMTLDQILNSVKGIPYVNNVVDDWDAKDYSWGVTKKVIEYAQYLQKNPQSVANLPPLVVIDGQLNDGAHRLSAINLLQKRMDPKNPLWKQVKLKVNFGTSADVASEQGVAEGLLKEDIMGAPRPEDNHEATMALSELYRNAKYGMALLKIIEPNDAIDGWVQANLTNAAEILDKVGHYLDYKNINGRKPEVNMDEDDNVDDAEPGDSDGSMARENLEMIVEYSIRLMEMIKPGDNLASWVSMKLTKASEAVSSAKHFIEYRNFEKHASDAFEGKITRMLAQKLSETMSPASTFVGSKKNKLGSAGQLKGNMKRSARAGDLVGGGAAESVAEDDEAMKDFLAKGGKIQHVKPQKGPKSPGLSYGSKHIGASGGRGSSKGKVSGLGAATRKSSSKPVVTAEQVSVVAHPTDTGDWSYSIDGKPVEPGSDLHNAIKDQHMDQVSPIYKPLKQMMSEPTDQSMGADPRKDSENDVQDGDVIIPSHPDGEWVKVRDIGENDNEKSKTVAKTWDEMSSKEKLSGVKGRTVWNPKTQKYRTVFDVPSQNKK
jgi:hypothetical protein